LPGGKGCQAKGGGGARKNPGGGGIDLGGGSGFLNLGGEDRGGASQGRGGRGGSRANQLGSKKKPVIFFTGGATQACNSGGPGHAQGGAGRIWHFQKGSKGREFQKGGGGGAPAAVGGGGGAGHFGAIRPGAWRIRSKSGIERRCCGGTGALLSKGGIGGRLSETKPRWGPEGSWAGGNMGVSQFFPYGKDPRGLTGGLGGPRGGAGKNKKRPRKKNP